MDCESVCLREIGGDEFDAAFHELRDQSDVAGEAVKLGDHQDRAEYATKPQRLVELWTGGLLPLSTSVNSVNNSLEVDSRNLLTAACLELTRFDGRVGA
jgi:hypothetical protein